MANKVVLTRSGGFYVGSTYYPPRGGAPVSRAPPVSPYARQGTGTRAPQRAGGGGGFSISGPAGATVPAPYADAGKTMQQLAQEQAAREAAEKAAAQAELQAQLRAAAAAKVSGISRALGPIPSQFEAGIRRGIKSFEPVREAVQPVLRKAKEALPGIGFEQYVPGTPQWGIMTAEIGLAVLPAALAVVPSAVQAGASLGASRETQEFLASPEAEVAAERSRRELEQRLAKRGAPTPLGTTAQIIEEIPGAGAVQYAFNQAGGTPREFRNIANQELINLGYTSAQANRLSGELTENFYGAGSWGEFAGLLAPGVAGEAVGQAGVKALLPRIFTSVAKKAGVKGTLSSVSAKVAAGTATKVEQKIYKSAVTKAFVAGVAPAGAVEGALSVPVVQAAKQRPTKPEEIAFGAVAGAVIAPAFFPVARYQFARPRVSKAAGVFGNILDVTEYPSDILYGGLRGAGRRAPRFRRGRMPTSIYAPEQAPVSPFAFTQQPVTVPTETRTRAEIIAEARTRARAQVPTGTRIVTDPFTGITTLIPAEVRTREELPVETEVPAETKEETRTEVPTKTDVPVSVTVPVPTLKGAPFIPFPPVGRPGEPGGAGVRRGRLEFFDELARARRAFQRVF